MLYAVMFKLYRDESYRERMLQGLVEQTNSSTNNPHEVEIRINILIFWVWEEEGTAHSILSMMCKVAKTAISEWNMLWQQLQCDIVRIRIEQQAEVGFFFIMRMEISLFLWKIFLVITLLDFEILELNRIMGMFLASGESMGFYSLNYFFFL